MEKHPITHSAQKYILPSNCEAGDNVGKVTLCFNTYPSWHVLYYGETITPSVFKASIVAGNDDNAFAINADTGELTITTPASFTETRVLTILSKYGVYFQETECTITYIPAADCIFFDPDFVGSSDGTRAAPYLKFNGSGLGNGTAGKTYLWRRAKTYLNETVKVVNAAGADWMQFGAWGQGAVPIIDGSTNNTADRFMDIGIFTGSIEGNNVRVFDFETTHDASTTWYPFQIQPFGSGLEMHRIKCTTLTFENGHFWFRASSDFGYINKNAILKDLESYDFRLDCRGGKFEAGGITADHFTADSAFAGNTSVGVSFAQMPNNTLRYSTAKSSSGQGLNIRAGNCLYEYCIIDGAANSLIGSILDGNDGLGGEFLVNGTSEFRNIIVRGSTAKVISFQRPSGLTDEINGLKFTNIIVQGGGAVGAEMVSYSKNIKLTNCVLSGLSSTGVRIFSTSTGNEIDGCTIANNTGTDINTNEPVTVNRTIYVTSSGTITGTGNSNNESDFVGAGDYRIDAGSVLIGAATRVTLYDALANDRLNPTTIGAFEYVLPIYNFDLSVTPAGAGTIAKSPAGFQNEGTSYTLTATPASGKAFVRFSSFFEGEWIELSTLNPLTANMPPYNLPVRAEFVDAVADTYALTLEVFPAAAGTVSQSPVGPHEAGTEVTLAVVASDNTFLGWYDGAVLLSASDPYVYTTGATEETISAVFEVTAATKIRFSRNLFGEEVQGVELNSTEPFYQLYGEVQVELVPGSGTFTKTIDFLLDPLADLSATFVINTGFRGHFIAPNFNPTTITTIQKVTYNKLKGKFFGGEYYGTTPEPVGVTELTDLVVLKAGIADSVGFDAGFDKLFTFPNKFLTFAPQIKVVSPTTPELLHFMFVDSGHTTVNLNVKLCYTDGTEYTYSPRSISDIDIYDIIRIPVGVTALGLANAFPVKVISHYQVWLSSGATIISESKLFELDYDLKPFERTWMYENSLGMPEIFRTIGKTNYTNSVSTTEARRAVVYTAGSGQSRFFTNQATSRRREEISTGFLRDLETARYMLDFTLQKGTLYEIKDGTFIPVQLSSPATFADSTDGEYNYFLRFSILGGYENESYTP
jgi:hypothetical protein